MQVDISEMVASLREGRWEEYIRLVWAAYTENDPNIPWSGLALCHGTEFDLFERLLAWPKNLLGSAAETLSPTVGVLPALPISDALRYLQYAAQVEPSYRHAVSSPVEPHIAASPSLGRELGEALRSKELLTGAEARVWAAAYACAAPGAAASYVLELVESGKDQNPLLLTTLVQFLPKQHEEILSSLAPLEAEIAAALLAATRIAGLDAWLALARIIEFSPAALRTILASVKGAGPEAAIALADSLYGAQNATVGVSAIPLEEVITDLLVAALSNDDVRRHVDGCVASLLHHKSLRPLVIPCIAELGGINEDVGQIFIHSIDSVSSRAADFGWLLTKWLLDSRTKTVSIRGLLLRCSSRYAPVALDVDLLNAASEERQVSAARQILALAYDGTVLCRFIAIFAESNVLQPRGLRWANEMLNEVFSEYPEASEAFLRLKTLPALKGRPYAHVYRGVLANALRWRRVLKSLPLLNELRPTDSEKQALRTLRQRMSRDIARGAEEKSIFSAITTKMSIAQGRRFAVHNGLGEPGVQSMESIGGSFELPSSETADPMRGLLKRSQMLKASR
ncbi:hypothetical protein [Duganella sp. S19_KUP01_CR8]|uniref:hypothetical protein n=1 Tax=Duganella sp. S19_KUP01_CR8 TaxID=3025502 RepID=UPI002FCDA4F0